VVGRARGGACAGGPGGGAPGVAQVGPPPPRRLPLPHAPRGLAARHAAAEPDLDALALEPLVEALEDARVAPRYVAEHLLLHAAAARRVEALDGCPDERRRRVAIGLAELRAQERQPEALGGAPAGPALEPVDHRD